MPLRTPNRPRYALRVTRYPALFLCWLLMGVAVARGATATATAKFNLAVDQANKAIQAGKFADAEKQIDVAAKLQPNAAEIPNLRGVLLTREQRYAEAVEKYNQALAIDPKFYPAKFNLAEVALLRGNVPEALQRYQELENVDRSSEVLQFKIAICCLLLGDETKAKAVTDIIPIPGNTPAYYYARAAAWFRKGNWPQVEYYVAAAHKYYPDGRCVYFEASLREVGLDLAKRNSPAATPPPSSPTQTPSPSAPSLNASPAASTPTPVSLRMWSCSLQTGVLTPFTPSAPETRPSNGGPIRCASSRARDYQVP